MKKTKIVKFMGGLGNQMFQYAFARMLKEKTGADILFDITWFERSKKYIIGETGRTTKGLGVRYYEMDIFKNAEIKIVNKFYSNLVKLSNILGFSKKYKEKNAFIYNEEPLNDDKYRYYTGYYQNENYFKSIRNILIHDFELPPLKEEDEYNIALLSEIQNSGNSVFIHVRREDYVTLGYSVSMEYYRKAVQYIKEHVENPVFYVFCAEDPDYIKNEFDLGCDFKLIGEKNKTRESFYENMRLMEACKHGIVANSSYSWWAAWLNCNEDKIIIAPSPWLAQYSDTICDDWIKIDVSK